MQQPNPDSIRAAVAATVRAELAARNVSGPEAARRTGISYQTLRRYLAGTRDFPVPDLYRVAEAIGIEPSLLVAKSVERMSESGSNVLPLRPKSAAEHLTAEEIDALIIDKAANRDAEIMRGIDDPD